MSHKTAKIAEMLAPFHGQGLDPHYLGFFDCFNRGRFFEAHEVLEDLWLADKTGSNGAFYKGLIQLAGAFVHVRKHRPGPAMALLRLARANLSPYPTPHCRLDLGRVLRLIDHWHTALLQAPEAALAEGAHRPPALQIDPWPGRGTA